MNGSKNNSMRDLGLIALSIILAVTLAKTGVLRDLLIITQEWRFIGSFLSGIFFVSIFTVTPSVVILIEIAKASSVWEVALFGGMGALIGDLLIFRFVRDSLAEDISWLMKQTKQERLFSIFRSKFLRWLTPFIGALIVASPLPDEIGLVMMGLSKMKIWVFIPVSFILNFLGILVIGLIAKGFFS